MRIIEEAIGHEIIAKFQLICVLGNFTELIIVVLCLQLSTHQPPKKANETVNAIENDVFLLQSKNINVTIYQQSNNQPKQILC